MGRGTRAAKTYWGQRGDDLTDILYQRDRETIAFVRSDLAVSGMGSWPVAQVAGIRAPSVV